MRDIIFFFAGIFLAAYIMSEKENDVIEVQYRTGTSF